MTRKLSCALVCVPLFILTTWAQNESQYHAGRLIKISDESFIDPYGPGKRAHLLHIQDGSNEYFALYSLNALVGHDRSDVLKPDSDVQYRISGKNLFLKIQDGKEIKGRLCDRVQTGNLSGLKCGDMTIFGPDAQ